MSKSPWSYSPTTGGFYHAQVHADRPADAIAVSKSRHAALIAAQESGCRIEMIDGAPTAVPPAQPGADVARSRAVAVIRAEAQRRILAIASIERQSNDNAALAIAALSGHLSDQAAAALERRVAIDAVRAASDAIEQRFDAGETLDPHDPSLWPTE